MQIADRKRPRAGGQVSSAAQATPPADWPAIVTLSGSPPNPDTLSRTHSSAAIQSLSPRFGGASSMARKPSAPSR